MKYKLIAAIMISAAMLSVAEVNVNEENAIAPEGRVNEENYELDYEDVVLTAGVSSYLYKLNCVTVEKEDIEISTESNPEETIEYEASLVEVEELNIEYEEEIEIEEDYINEGEVEWFTGYTEMDLNVRSEPDSDSELITTLPINTEVEYCCYDLQWSRIKINDGYGYIKTHVSDEKTKVYTKVSATAYYNKYNSACSDGTWPYEGVLAGKKEWIGKKCYLYDKNMNCLGYYEFHDVGYGKSIGYGKSRLLSGRKLGTIEAGVDIDIFMESRSECMKWGRRTVYIEWIED